MITCKSRDEIRSLRAANAIVADVLDELCEVAAPGVTTLEPDKLAESRVLAVGGTPAFKGYHGFPATLCVSINEAVVHGIPSDRALQDGDIVSLDMGVVLDGYFGDSAVTIAIGHVSDEANELLRITREALDRAIEQVEVGRHLSDLGHAVQQHVERHGFSVVREFVGHGIGTQLHEEPQIPNYGEPGRGPLLKAGMVLAIEPMVNTGRPDVRVLNDGWTAVTVDGSLSAHFEHSVAVTDSGPEVLSRRGRAQASASRSESRQVTGVPAE